MDSQVLQHFEGRVDYWTHSLDNPVFRRRFQAVVKMIGPFAGSVLDIGCGPGLYAQLFDHDAYTGIDISPAMIRRARELNPGYSFKTGYADMLVPSKLVDLVLSIAVLEYMPAPYLHMNVIYRALKPGGRAIIAVRNGYERYRERDRMLLGFLGKPIERKDFEYKAYTIDELPLGGFRVRRVQFSNMVLVPAIIDKRIHINWILERLCPWWRRRYCGMYLLEVIKL